MLSGLGAQYSALTGQAAMFGARSQMGSTIGQLGFQVLGMTGLPDFKALSKPVQGPMPQ
jgi:hypothetical protein